MLQEYSGEIFRRDREQLTQRRKNVEKYHNNATYFNEILQQASKMPLDFMRPVLSDMFSNCEEEDGRQCPKCSTPWLSGFCRSRLLKRMKRDEHVRSLLKKERKFRGKMKNSERLKIAMYRTGMNILEVTCLVCKHKMKKPFPVPGAKVKPAKVKKEIKKDDVSEISKQSLKKKLKKKKLKELHAGLIISSESREHLTTIRHPKCPKTDTGSPGSQSQELETCKPIGETSTPEGNQDDNLSERLVDSVVSPDVSQGTKLMCKGSYSKNIKRREITSNTLKKKMKFDQIMTDKKNNVLGNFLSSLF